jgi:hypothetical protein
VLLNMTDGTRNVLASGVTVGPTARVAFGTHRQKDSRVGGEQVELAPFEALVIDLDSTSTLGLDRLDPLYGA